MLAMEEALPIGKPQLAIGCLVSHGTTCALLGKGPFHCPFLYTMLTLTFLSEEGTLCFVSFFVFNITPLQSLADSMSSVNVFK